jgi:nucleotidyltransferase substrate binding protein (TIGR01987 family)
MIDTTSLEKALFALKKSIKIAKHYLSDHNGDPDLNETIRSGVIQHFEICYELSWKMLKRQIELDSAIPVSVDALSYPELIREGAERGFIVNAKNWLLYRHQRNITSHTYNEDKAKSVYLSTLDFYADALSLLNALKERQV